MKRSGTIANHVYKFVYHKDVFIKTNLIGRNFKNEWVEIESDGKIIIKGSSSGGYAWDGCSPKWHFIDLMWGTPDGKLDFRTEKPITYFASMIHDVIYQFKEELDISRKEADIIFKLILNEAGFMWCGLYFFSVRIGGRFYGTWKRKISEKKVALTESSWLNQN
ncbi:MAG: hypothetical protein AAGI07_19320 [Bacteroidota bacterium]